MWSSKKRVKWIKKYGNIWNVNVFKVYSDFYLGCFKRPRKFVAICIIKILI